MNPDKKIQEVYRCIDSKGVLYEEIYNPETKVAQFVWWDGHKIKTCDFVDVNKIRYKPVTDETVTEKLVLLPTHPKEFGDLELLAKKIEKHAYKYVDVPDKFRQLGAWYAISSYMIDKIGTTSYLRAIGDYATGKSRFIRVFGGLCYKPIFISGAVTQAVIYRIINKTEGTLVFDEMDLKFSSENNFIVKILNCGSEVNKPVIRCDPNNPKQIDSFKTFGTKVFSTRKRFQDHALETRCITQVMKETNRKDIPTLLYTSHPFYQEEMELRNMLLMFRLQNYYSLKLVKENEIDLGNIEPRLKQDMMPIAMLFWKFQEMKKFLLAFLSEYNKELIEERACTFEGMIVNSIYALFDEAGEANDVPRITSKIIAEKIKEKYKMETEPRPNAIGRVLRMLGIASHPTKIDGKTKRIILWDENLMASLRRKYVIPVTLVTAVTDEKGGYTANSSENIANNNDITMKDTLSNNFEDIKKEDNNISTPSNNTVTTVTSVTSSQDAEFDFSPDAKVRTSEEIEMSEFYHFANFENLEKYIKAKEKDDTLNKYKYWMKNKNNQSEDT